MSNIGTLPGDRLAGLSADLFHKLQAGTLTIEEFTLFVQRKNPFTFERNKHGHIIVTITSPDLSGAQEIERLEASGYRVGNHAKYCFTSSAKDSYDVNHRLVAGKVYKIALVPGKSVEFGSEHTTTNLRKLCAKKYGYGKPLAGIIPRIRETISDKQMEEMGIWYIAALHEPIRDFEGLSCMFGADRRGDDGQWVSAYCDCPGNGWPVAGAFAFPITAS